MTRPWRDVLADIVVCLQFFSRLPVRRVGTDGARSFAQAIRMLPVAGVVIGACGGLALLAGAALDLPPALSAMLGVAAGLLASGGLHEDGLADTADGFGGGGTRERKLAIMRDSRIGTFGVLAVALALGWRIAALAALLGRLPPGSVAALAMAMAAGSRALCLLPLALLHPARPDGLGRGVGRVSGTALSTCFALAALIGVALPVLAGIGIGRALLACALAAAAAAAVTRLAYRQIGGHTGDVAGACQQAAEAAFMLGLLVAPAAGHGQ